MLPIESMESLNIALKYIRSDLVIFFSGGLRRTPNPQTGTAALSPLARMAGTILFVNNHAPPRPPSKIPVHAPVLDY